MKRVYLNTTDEPTPPWAVAADEALARARAAADAARTALVDAMIANAESPDVAEAISKRLDKLADALDGGAAYGPFAMLVQGEWTGGDSHEPKNHRRYIA